MTGPLALHFDTYYHIYNRGINREAIFFEEKNYAYFVKLYEKYIDPLVHTYAFCLLKNHFHFLLKIKTQDEIYLESQSNINVEEKLLSQKFSDFFNAYARAVNIAYKRTGSLFQHPFGRVMITSDVQLWHVVAYIHQNPQKHGLVDDFRDWKWSSYSTIISDLPTKVDRKEVLDWFWGKQNFMDLSKQWVDEANIKWGME